MTTPTSTRRTRSKKAAEQPEDTSTANGSTEESVNGTSKEGTTRKRKYTPRNAAQPKVIGEFAVVDAQEVPGKGIRNNPYDDIVKDSYEADLHGQGNWISFLTTPDAVEDQEKLLRSAASWHQIGVEIRDEKDGEDENGKPTYKTNDEGYTRMWFRGREKRARSHKNATTENDTENDGESSTE